MKALLAALLVCASAGAAEVSHYQGICEASAAVALDGQHFAVADDESNALMVYKLGSSQPVRRPIEMADFLATAKKASDLEAGARVGDVVYWMSSHSLTAAGKNREWRRRFFATQVDATVTPPSLKPLGKPYTGLLDALIAAPGLKSLHLDNAAALPPEAPGGLNIEGLAANADGSLLIGFRSPLVGSKALVVPLLNPAQIVGSGARPSFGTPITIDLGGRGIRSIDAIGSSGFLVVAGPTGSAGSFALFRWTGVASDAPIPLKISIPAKFSPEALVVLPGARDVLMLSDDGERCNPLAMKFQALSVPLP